MSAYVIGTSPGWSGNCWITAFFPYLRHPRSERGMVPNFAIRDGGERLRETLSGTGPIMEGLTSERIPSALAEAPFEWEYLNRRHDMRFVAGFVGVRQDEENLSVRPEIGWAVYEPAQVEAARAIREEEFLRTEEEASNRAFAFAQAWTSKGRCSRCGEWVYSYDINPPRRHCGADMVDVSYR